MGVSGIGYIGLGGTELRQWRAGRYLTQGEAGRWFGLSSYWVKYVESGRIAPRDLSQRIERVFARYARLEAIAKSVEAELGLDKGVSPARRRMALSAAIEAMREAEDAAIARQSLKRLIVKHILAE
jgi:hypothetical protein